MENNYSKLTNLEIIKEFSNAHFLEIAMGDFRTVNHGVKVRVIDPNGKFNIIGLGRFFFVDDCIYIITNDKKYESFHNPDILDFDEELDILKYTGEYIIRVIFAGVFTGFYDDKENRVFTGDVVRARVLVNAAYPSTGGNDRAKSTDEEIKARPLEGGVSDMYGKFSIILDKHCAPLSWATELEVIGSLFYDLKKDDAELEIMSLCNQYAQYRDDNNELRELIKKSPYFPPTTWQEKALEVLGVDYEDEEIDDDEQS